MQAAGGGGGSGRCAEPSSYAFAGFEIDASIWELRRAGWRVPIEPRPFELLLHLLRNRERVVGKAELRAALWPGVALGESALGRCVWAARRAVGDDGSRQAVIRTVFGRGYRFVAPLEGSTPGVGSGRLAAPPRAPGRGSVPRPSGR